MSDSRISVAVAEVSAAIELLTNARTVLCGLLNEDPAFAVVVQRGLREATQELWRADITASSGLERLRAADFLENGTRHVPSLP